MTLSKRHAPGSGIDEAGLSQKEPNKNRMGGSESVVLDPWTFDVLWGSVIVQSSGSDPSGPVGQLKDLNHRTTLPL